MALGPAVFEIRPFDRILYATHLDPVSKSDFRYAVEIARAFRSELTVFHALSRSQRDRDSENLAAVGEPLPLGSHLMRRARAWSKWASRKGVSTEVVFERSSADLGAQFGSADL